MTFLGKFSNAEFSREFDIGDHPTVVTCLAIAAVS